MTIGEKIRTLRGNAGLSQSQLADALTVSRAAVAKWENDNGTPDLENLKALAAYFSCDVDLLIHDDRELEPVKSQLTIPDTFCGKDCQSCEHRQTLGCEGCKNGPGKRFQESCEIASCARNKSPYGCVKCEKVDCCATIRRTDVIPRARLEKQQRDEKQRRQNRQMARMFRGPLWALFWISIAQILFSLNIGTQSNTVLIIALCVLEMIPLAVYFAVEIYLGKVTEKFKTSALCYLAILVLTPVSAYLLEATEMKLVYIFVCVGVLIANILRINNEFGAYSEVLYAINAELAEKWINLKVLSVLAQIGTIAGTIIMVLFNAIGTLMVLAGGIALLIARVKELYYRYCSASEMDVAAGS